MICRSKLYIDAWYNKAYYTNVLINLKKKKNLASFSQIDFLNKKKKKERNEERATQFRVFINSFSLEKHCFLNNYCIEKTIIIKIKTISFW